MTTTISKSEVLKFSQAAKEWWDPRGQFKMLHRMNPIRTNYIRTTLNKPLTDLAILDIGCGGGLLSESLARLGADVLGVDASRENILMANIHKEKDFLFKDLKLEYLNSTAEDLSKETPNKFDIICALEIIEHVENRTLFLTSLLNLLKPNGTIFISTINKTTTSYLFTILLAEHLLKWVPPGTHDHSKYVCPKDLERELGERVDGVDVRGMAYNPVTGRWRLLGGGGFGDLEMNYILSARKKK